MLYIKILVEDKPLEEIEYLLEGARSLLRLDLARPASLAFLPSSLATLSDRDAEVGTAPQRTRCSLNARFPALES